MNLKIRIFVYDGREKIDPNIVFRRVESRYVVFFIEAIGFVSSNSMKHK